MPSLRASSRRNSPPPSGEMRRSPGVLSSAIRSAVSRPLTKWPPPSRSWSRRGRPTSTVRCFRSMAANDAAVTRAAVLRSVGSPLAIEEIHLPAPAEGEVHVRLAAAGVCHSDLSLANGTLVQPVPAVLGHEGAGTVLAVGPGGDACPSRRPCLVELVAVMRKLLVLFACGTLSLRSDGQRLVAALRTTGGRDPTLCRAGNRGLRRRNDCAELGGAPLAARRRPGRGGTTRLCPAHRNRCRHQLGRRPTGRVGRRLRYRRGWPVGPPGRAPRRGGGGDRRGHCRR